MVGSLDSWSGEEGERIWDLGLGTGAEREEGSKGKGGGGTHI